MALRCRTLALGVAASGLAVRPRGPASCETTQQEVATTQPADGPADLQQAALLLMLRSGDVHELFLGSSSSGCSSSGGDAELGPRLASGVGSSPAFDPASGCLLFTAHHGTAVGRLDGSGRVSRLAGCEESGMRDGGVGAAAFLCIACLAADGRGGVWVADGGRIRRVDTCTGAVTTLTGAEAVAGWWWSVAYDAAAGELLAATGTAVCRVRGLRAAEGGGEGGGGGGGGVVEVLAGSWTEQGSADGSGGAARFRNVTALLPVAGGRLLIADGPDLRCLDAGGSGAVTTLLRGCFPERGARQLALLPSGELAAVPVLGRPSTAGHGGPSSSPAASRPDAFIMIITVQGFAPRRGPSTDRLLGLLAAPVEGPDGGEMDSGGRSSTATATTAAASAGVSGAVAVRVGGHAFTAHRSVLAAGSDYFARLLAPGGSFADSGAAEVALPDADPAAFAHLLSYMYGTSMRLPCTPAELLDVAPELLRPAAALAGRLLMGGAVSALTERLAAAATPATVLSDLLWADAYGMTELAGRLRAVALARPNKGLELGCLLGQGVERCPEQATALMEGLLQGAR
ncbi:hypothetical protein HYH03_018462 [Edaphochlamys debaryana]|uniref:BTB domain-containing protein n=1 Tax=Edaphochlamys debaryana TaxID=47281 RepID=A0A836BN37_9CHLO|nr:hypothetical protein HYH03_018462 [Edaphochlamys debaryana]|eukprot:KAG2482620.1 hypothetical protein HYH03_018462 [Edaphochlamys debaryana]